ncbi:hypothetical protein AQI88_26430 [Streptomyces cellostaticus]|uniref:Uncharacterized protein n=1 Tax=Streptomyces cellostaticus TaxID=67285 RepID=A0A117PV70_9ACTN|nr:hypothetical protein [Streptomyces cellostaticus]KUM93516.1 hypothetical protein AQI88_26430 [Streptomyces cellostaticus]GHI10169.1 hypothetical protein Scel_84900 [Streptomyces cellostaticus]
MTHASSRPAGVHRPGEAVAGPFHHRLVRAVVPALLLAVLPAQLAMVPTPERRAVVTGIESISPARDIPLCC